jgi:hypothetical protein
LIRQNREVGKKIALNGLTVLVRVPFDYVNNFSFSCCINKDHLALNPTVYWEIIQSIQTDDVQFNCFHFEKQTDRQTDSVRATVLVGRLLIYIDSIASAGLLYS